MLIMAGLLLVALASVNHYRDDVHPANEAARVYAALAIVDHGTVALDPVFDDFFPGWRARNRAPNADVARMGDRHLLDKAPGLTFLSVPVVASLRLLGIRPGFATLTWLLALLLSALPSAVFAAAMWRRFHRDPALSGAPGWLAPLIVLGTPWLAYGGMLFGHALAAVLAGSGALLALGPMNSSSGSPSPSGRMRTRWASPFLGGLALGGAVLTDYPTAALVVLVAAAMLADREGRRRLPALVVGGIGPALCLVAWNMACFDHPFAMSYGFKNDPALAAIHAQGAFGFTFPAVERLMGILASARRGLFFLAPWLAVGLAGAVPAIVDRGLSRQWRIVLAGGSVGYPLMVAGFVDWQAGMSMGPRHLLPAIPFMGLSMARLLARAGTGSASTLAQSGLLGLGLSASVLCAIGAWVFPYFSTRVKNPIFEVALPVLLEGGPTPTIWDSILPSPAGFLVAGAAGLVALAVASRKPGPLALRRIPLVALLALMHLGAASRPSTDGPDGLARVLADRALAFELNGRYDLGGQARDALKRARQAQ
jgi:hypothetical protein